jgi:hypothetical protein
MFPLMPCLYMSTIAVFPKLAQLSGMCLECHPRARRHWVELDAENAPVQQLAVTVGG